MKSLWWKGPLEWHPDGPQGGIHAEVRSDDAVYYIEFDARPFFEAAEDDEILAIAEEDWGGGYAVDEVARYMAEQGHPMIKRMFQYLRDVSDQRNPPGFEVRVYGDDVLAWMAERRPELLNHPWIKRWL